jgi:hypothetical protein
VETGSFTIEFLEHVPTDRRKFWLDLLKNKGARVEQLNDRVFHIHCSDRREIRRAGNLLLWPMRNVCSVIGTTGTAEARASSYWITGKHLRVDRLDNSGLQPGEITSDGAELITSGEDEADEPANSTS